MSSDIATKLFSFIEYHELNDLSCVKKKILILSYSNKNLLHNVVVIILKQEVSRIVVRNFIFLFTVNWKGVYKESSKQYFHRQDLRCPPLFPLAHSLLSSATPTLR